MITSSVTQHPLNKTKRKIGRISHFLSILLISLQGTFVHGSENSQRSYAVNSELPIDTTTPVCAKVENLDFPKKDQPSASKSTASSLQNCDSEQLYYGIGIPVDLKKARECAFLEINKEQNAFNGASILMMIYANGAGVERNLDLALKLACHGAGAWAPAELSSRIAHVIKLKEDDWQGSDFNVCDDITSGYMMGVCAAHESRIADAQRKSKFAKITHRWSKRDIREFQTLKTAANNFFNARSSKEVDQTGTARALLSIHESEDLEDDFLSSIQDLEQGKFPKFSNNDFQIADAKLNKIYNKIMQDQTIISMTTITAAGIKQTQQLWLKYRDAWVVFAHQKYPNVTDDSIKTWLTQKRSKMLEEFVR